MMRVIGRGVSEVLRDLAADARVAARRSAHAGTQVVLSDAEADALLTDARLLARIASDIEVLAEASQPSRRRGDECTEGRPFGRRLHGPGRRARGRASLLQFACNLGIQRMVTRCKAPACLRPWGEQCRGPGAAHEGRRSVARGSEV